ncbi:hypothetical protein FORC13_p164 (plasmid) [Bacillus cereus]|nr:hypothetical protein FORC13_p164 [Bacillus cereus]
MKPILKIKENGVISIVQLIQMDTLDIQLRKKQDHQAAYTFMKRLVKTFGEPKILATDKAPTLLCALKKLKQQGCYKHTTHCTIKHLNNL